MGRGGQVDTRGLRGPRYSVDSVWTLQKDTGTDMVTGSNQGGLCREAQGLDLAVRSLA